MAVQVVCNGARTLGGEVDLFKRNWMPAGESAGLELLLTLGVPLPELGGFQMQAAIDRVMQTYGLMVNLTPGRRPKPGRRSPTF